MTNYEHLLQTAESEFALTLKLIKAFPGDQLDFKPHTTSASARNLLMILIVESELIKRIIHGTMKEWSGMDTFNRESILEFADTYELSISETLTALRNLGEEGSEEVFQGFGTEQQKITGIWMMMFDQIHHRGQLSVYIRMTGGKVPSIYGPSADEPGLPNPQ
jgi:uncharacterized damage-inducible protein DinB